MNVAKQTSVKIEARRNEEKAKMFKPALNTKS